MLDLSKLFLAIELFELFNVSFDSSLIFVFVPSFEEDSVSLFVVDPFKSLFDFIYSLKDIHFVLSLFNL